MYIEPAYPSLASDPRLTSVHSEWKKIRREIDNDDWDDKPVPQWKRERCRVLSEMYHNGIEYIPNF